LFEWSKQAKRREGGCAEPLSESCVNGSGSQAPAGVADDHLGRQDAGPRRRLLLGGNPFEPPFDRDPADLLDRLRHRRDARPEQAGPGNVIDADRSGTS